VREGAATARGNLIAELLEELGPSSDQQHGGARPTEHPGARLTHPGGRSGHQYDLPGDGLAQAPLVGAEAGGAEQEAKGPR
jgi:hypothetical protein